MSVKKKLVNELKSFGITTLYFALWFGILMLIKVILLEKYKVEFEGVSMALIGALVVAKVILILENVNLGSWVRKKPAIVDIIVRTLLYVGGVAIVMLLEKSFDGRNEYGGFWQSLENVFQHADIHHFWVAVICVTLAILGFNTISVINKALGKGKVRQIIFSPIKEFK